MQPLIQRGIQRKIKPEENFRYEPAILASKIDLHKRRRSQIKKSDNMTCTSTDLLDENLTTHKDLVDVTLPNTEANQDRKKVVVVNESTNT